MILKFAMRYFVLEVEDYDTLDDAVRSAYWAAEAGRESVVCIEVVGGPDARVYDTDEVRALMRPLEDAASAAYMERPRSQAEVWIATADGEKASYESYVDPLAAVARVAELRLTLGDRVWWEPLDDGKRMMPWELEKWQAKHWEQARVGR